MLHQQILHNAMPIPCPMEPHAPKKEATTSIIPELTEPEPLSAAAGQYAPPRNEDLLPARGADTTFDRSLAQTQRFASNNFVVFSVE